MKYDQDDLAEAMNALKEEMFNDLLDVFIADNQLQQNKIDSSD